MTARRAAIVAENKPVYVIQMRYAVAGEEMRAHKNQDPISILSNVFGNSISLFLGDLGVHGVDWTTIYRAYS